MDCCAGAKPRRAEAAIRLYATVHVPDAIATLTVPSGQSVMVAISLHENSSMSA